MKISIEFHSGFEKGMAAGVVLLVLAAAFLLGYVLSPPAAYAEWDSSSAFGDSYYLKDIADNIDDVSDELYDISSTLSEIERAMP